MENINLSVIVPVYNRAVEVKELLQSIYAQTNTDFEVVIVEDGSTEKCKNEVDFYSDKLNIKYFEKPNSGPGQSRNYGFERASGNYGIFLDSDCILPKNYIQSVITNLQNNYVDAFGGPDKADESFTVIQKAINYSMTSFFTTGGIRGGGEKLEKFHPRSFNMGYSKDVFDVTKGFSKMRFGEDIDMSIRIIENNFETRLIKEAFVYHKRRTNLRQFFKQIYNSGIARINLYKRHPQSLKLVHFLPAVFTIGLLGTLLFSGVFTSLFLLPLVLFSVLLFADSSVNNKSIKIGLYSVITSYIQLLAYGIGFINAFWQRVVLRKNEFSAFKDTFYD